MKTELIKKDTSFKPFIDAIRTFEADPKVKGILIFACDDDGYTPEGIDSILKSCKLPVFGGVFPQIILKNKKYDQGTLIVGLEQKPDIFVVQELSNTELVYEDQLEVLSLDEECKTAFNSASKSSSINNTREMQSINIIDLFSLSDSISFAASL